MKYYAIENKEVFHISPKSLWKHPNTIIADDENDFKIKYLNYLGIEIPPLVKMINISYYKHCDDQLQATLINNDGYSSSYKDTKTILAINKWGERNSITVSLHRRPPIDQVIELLHSGYALNSNCDLKKVSKSKAEKNISKIRGEIQREKVKVRQYAKGLLPEQNDYSINCLRSCIGKMKLHIFKAFKDENKNFSEVKIYTFRKSKVQIEKDIASLINLLEKLIGKRKTKSLDAVKQFKRILENKEQKNG